MTTPKKKRGFALHSPERRSEIARSGGNKTTLLGTSHFVQHPMSRQKAQIYGRYGGMLSHGGGRPRKSVVSRDKAV